MIYINSYYVYEHIRKDNDTVFYVGKGHNRRAWEKGRNQKHDEIADKYGLEVRIVKKGLSEEEAYQEEYNTIKELLDDGYGIDKQGTSIKVNTNDGVYIEGTHFQTGVEPHMIGFTLDKTVVTY